MNNHLMLIDNQLFAKNSEHLVGELSVAELTRLCEWLQDKANTSKQNWQPEGVVAYELRGNVNALKQYYLKLDLHVKLSTICQRCLGEMPCQLDLSFNYLVAPETNMQSVEFQSLEYSDVDDQDDIDLLAASQSMNLIVLIEDEVMLALPISPLHDAHCIELNLQSGEKPNPFAALKKLIKS